MNKDKLNIIKKVIKTEKWAKIMTKQSITFHTPKRGKTWQIVSFEGPKGRESKGIVDLIAVRKDFQSHQTKILPLKKGDLFEIVLIQVKGGALRWPKKQDIERLKKVRKYYHAKHIIFVHWSKGSQPLMYRLNNKHPWIPTSANEIFA